MINPATARLTFIIAMETLSPMVPSIFDTSLEVQSLTESENKHRDETTDNSPHRFCAEIPSTDRWGGRTWAGGTKDGRGQWVNQLTPQPEWGALKKITCSSRKICFSKSSQQCGHESTVVREWFAEPFLPINKSTSETQYTVCSNEWRANQSKSCHPFFSPGPNYFIIK